MGIDYLVNEYFILLLVGGLISFFVGFGFMEKFKSHGIGVFLLFILSLFSLIILVLWFQTASATLLIGTIPWLFDQAIAIILYPVYLTIAWFTLKRLYKKNLSS